jgi:ATP-dependent protease ClpP protease subunit
MIEEKPNRIMMRENTSRNYIIRICREISEVDDFDDELQVLAGASPNDTVQLILNTPGGSVDTALILCKALRACEARTSAFIGFTCASAGTAIALACDEWEIDEYSSFMVHTGSYGTGFNTAPNIFASVQHMDKMVNRFVENTYSGFLTPEEMDIVKGGRDVYFEGEELAQRLGAFADYRYALEEAAHAEMMAEMDQLALDELEQSK